MSKIEFLAIGDIVVDAFIKLKDANVHCKINSADCELCVRFGDKVPYEDVEVVPAVGNCANAAVAAARMGLDSYLVTNVGRDDDGKDCIAALKKDKVKTKYIAQERGKKTNYHYVLSYEVDRTILVKHEHFDYKLPKLPKIEWMYFTSLGENTLPYHQEIAEYLKAHPDTKLAFQPGTFQMKLGVEALKDIYSRTEAFFCNVEEAQRILGTETRDIKELSAGIHALGPKIVAISDGPNGAYASDGTDIWFIPIYPDIAPPKERTGAGDAFSSTFTIALALGKSIPEALSWGPINSMSVVQQTGAQRGLLSRKELEDYLAKAPEDYKPRKI